MTLLEEAEHDYDVALSAFGTPMTEPERRFASIRLENAHRILEMVNRAQREHREHFK